MRCPRLYPDGNGVSRFEDVEIPLATVDFTPPAPPINISDAIPVERAIFLNVGKDWNGIPHPAPARALFVFTGGDWEVTAGDGETRRFRAGDVLRVEDTTGAGHSTRVVGEAEGTALLIALR